MSMPLTSRPGKLDITLANSNPNMVDVDSMYGLRAYRRSTGEYEVTKDDYNDSNVVVYRWAPPGLTGMRVSAPRRMLASPFSVN